MSDLKVFNQTITNPKTQAYLDSVLGEEKAAFVNNVVAVVANDAKLQVCDPMTLLFAAIKATSLKLPLDQNLGFAYIIPYKNNKENKTEAQFQIGYKGITQLAVRSKQFEKINVTDVREGELLRRDRRTGDIQFAWIDDDTERNKRKVIGYLGYFRLKNGYEKESYWTVEELQAHGLRYSQTYSSRNEYVRKSSKWATDFDAMARKTVIKLMLNKGDAPMSIEMQEAVKYDQSVIIDEKGTAKYIDNQPKPSSEDQAAEFVEAEDVTTQTEPESEQPASETLFGEEA